MNRTPSTTPALFARLWDDDLGAIITVELVIYLTVLVIGLVPALVALRQGTLSEIIDLANSFMALDQSYSYSGQQLLHDGNRRTARDTFRNTTGNGWRAPVNREAHGDPRHSQARTAGSAFSNRPADTTDGLNVSDGGKVIVAGSVPATTIRKAQPVD